ncbi:DUF1304 domain-containing protein [Streptococcus iniae]|uniref:DUF1304 domain-containing protein n=1 Tax=Streptococcus iniae TaxID=1346 RepID=UPI002B31E7B9|nr:DUF1304 domain-containing protein [Streptococcus iniae]
MSIITLILATLVALEQAYIMYIETFATQSTATQRIFNISKEELENPTIDNLFKNQGIYNGLIALFLIYGLFIAQNSEIVALFLVNILAATLYGALTVDKKILFKQGGVALMALISLLF